MIPITEPGIYPSYSADDYFADPCPTPSLNQSLIKVLDDASPLHAAFGHVRLNPYGRRDDSSRAQFFGSAVHRLALGAGKPVTVLRYPDFKHSSARNARDEAIRRSEIPLLERDYDRAVSMAATVRERIEEEAAGDEFLTEVPVYARMQTAAGWIWVRAMLDVWIPAQVRILDVKTTRGLATPEAVGRDVTQNRYDLQDAWYPHLVTLAAPELAGRVRFEFLYVESDAPHGSATHYLDEESRYFARRICERAAETFARSLNLNTWPSYPRGANRIATAKYYQNAQLEREIGESAA